MTQAQMQTAHFDEFLFTLRPMRGTKTVVLTLTFQAHNDRGELVNVARFAGPVADVERFHGELGALIGRMRRQAAQSEASGEAAEPPRARLIPFPGAGSAPDTTPPKGPAEEPRGGDPVDPR